MAARENYKIGPGIRRFILEQKRGSPGLSCRAISVLVRRRFNVSVSKSRVNEIIRRPLGPRQEAAAAAAAGRAAPSRLPRPLVSYLHFGLFDGTVFYVDGEFRFIRGDKNVSGEFCAPLDKVVDYVKTRILRPAGQPIIACQARAAGRSAALNLMLCCEGAPDKALSRIVLYDKAGQEIERFSYIPKATRRYFILGTPGRAVKRKGSVIFSWKGRKFGFRAVALPADAARGSNMSRLITNIPSSAMDSRKVVSLFVFRISQS